MRKSFRKVKADIKGSSYQLTLLFAKSTSQASYVTRFKYASEIEEFTREFTVELNCVVSTNKV